MSVLFPYGAHTKDGQDRWDTKHPARRPIASVISRSAALRPKLATCSGYPKTAGGAGCHVVMVPAAGLAQPHFAEKSTSPAWPNPLQTPLEEWCDRGSTKFGTIVSCFEILRQEAVTRQRIWGWIDRLVITPRREDSWWRFARLATVVHQT